MDAELRALVHRLAADPGDRAAGLALARALARREGEAPASGVEAVPVPAEVAPGSLVVLVRRARPRALFAWPEALDEAIGRVARVSAIAADRLTCELEIADVGRFHAGAAGLHAIAELRGASPRDESALAPLEPGPARLQGGLGDDGLTAAQRALLEALASGEIAPVEAVAARAGFSRENNRSAASARAVLDGMASPTALPLVNLVLPDLLGGDVVAGEGEAPASWTENDRWVVLEARANAIVGGMPWTVVSGVWVDETFTPPHEPREVAAALLHLLESPRAGLDAVMRVLPGPDFAGERAGGADEVRQLYETGEATLRLRTSFELRLPSTVVVGIPGPLEGPLGQEGFVDTISAAVRASRLEGVNSIKMRPPFTVLLQADRGTDLASFKERIEDLWAKEREVRYRLPRPMVDWLGAFLDDRRRRGLSDGDVRRAILGARPATRTARRGGT